VIALGISAPCRYPEQINGKQTIMDESPSRSMFLPGGLISVSRPAGIPLHNHFQRVMRYQINRQALPAGRCATATGPCHGVSRPAVAASWNAMARLA
jgi:hypothetical protein